MRRRLLFTVLGVAGITALALAAGLVSARGSGGTELHAWGLQPGTAAVPAVQGIHQPRTLVLTLANPTQTQIDNGTSGDSPGDEVVVHGPLLRDGTTVGVLDVHGVITAVGARSERIQYTFTASLPDGQISSIGVVQIQNNVTGFRGAVVGGTLHYRNARGQVRVTFSQNGGAHFTYALIP
jgi:hypothetical protein